MNEQTLAAIRTALEMALHDLTVPQHLQHFGTVPQLRQALSLLGTLSTTDETPVRGEEWTR